MQQLERPEFESIPGPGAYRVLQKGRDMTSKRSSIGCGYFGASPRFHTRSERCRLSNPNELQNNNDGGTTNYEKLNKQEVVALTDQVRKMKFKTNGIALNNKIAKARKKRIALLMKEDERCSLILARPEKLKRKRRIKTLMMHLLNGIRIQKLMESLTTYWEKKEIENIRISSVYFFQRFFKYWKNYIVLKKSTRFQHLFYCSSIFLRNLYRIRNRTHQSNVLRKHLYAQISAHKVLSKIRSYREKACMLQRWVRGRIMREACHLIIVVKQLTTEWNKRYDKPDVVGMATEKNNNNDNGSLKKKKKRKAKKNRKGMVKNSNNSSNVAIPAFVKPTETELTDIMVGVARRQLSLWRTREQERKYGTTGNKYIKKRFGLFTEIELDGLMFESYALWEARQRMV